MRQSQRIYSILGGLILIGFYNVCVAIPSQTDAVWKPLSYAPAPIDNPLKGLVPYAGEHRSQFPHSMEFQYLALSALVVGDGKYDWQPLERILDDIASRGHQTVFRIFLEYPGKKDVIPKYLLDGGLKVHRYLNTNTAPFPPTEVETPDYRDPRLRKMLREFIGALGKKYDGDPRIGFITAGLLGTWGEWHDYPRTDLYAPKECEVEVMDSYKAAFRITPILLRYPAGPSSYSHAPNHMRQFGYHDDSFAWSTLKTGRKGDEWFFLQAMEDAGKEAVEKWRSRPIGGEIRPEAWGTLFDAKPAKPEIQDFDTCVRETHASWLMDSGMFRSRVSEERQSRARESVGKMGYEFTVTEARLRLIRTGLMVQLRIKNRGVAPFYAQWRAEVGLRNNSTGTISTYPSKITISGPYPDAPPQELSDFIDLKGLSSGSMTVMIRIPNPLKSGKSLRFANREQDKDAPDWLSLGQITLVR